jgi:hypothetical protein
MIHLTRFNLMTTHVLIASARLRLRACYLYILIMAPGYSTWPRNPVHTSFHLFIIIIILHKAAGQRSLLAERNTFELLGYPIQHIGITCSALDERLSWHAFSRTSITTMIMSAYQFCALSCDVSHFLKLFSIGLHICPNLYDCFATCINYKFRHKQYTCEPG